MQCPDKKAGTYISGIYIVYAKTFDKLELVYIGRSGKKGSDGNIKHRIAGCGGIRDRIINGKDSDKKPRRKAWAEKMKSENIEELHFYWYIIYDEVNKDFPEDIEDALISFYRPKWNRTLK